MERSPYYCPFGTGIHRSLANSSHKWPVMQCFDIFYDADLNKQSNKCQDIDAFKFVS